MKLEMLQEVEACEWLTSALRGIEAPNLDPAYANMRAVCSFLYFSLVKIHLLKQVDHALAIKDTIKICHKSIKSNFSKMTGMIILISFYQFDWFERICMKHYEFGISKQ